MPCSLAEIVWHAASLIACELIVAGTSQQALCQASVMRACRYTKAPEAVELMGRIKGVFDPNGILNPYKVLPQAVTSRHDSTAMAA